MNPTTNSIYDDPNLKSARSNYESASKEAQASETAGYSLPDQLKSALTAKFSQDNPLIQSRESALKNYLNETTAGPLSVTPTSAGGTAPVVLNPLQQADLIQRRKSNVLAPLTTANDLLGLETGSMADIINAASRAQQGQTARLQGKAKLAGDSYTNILNELSAKAEQAWKEKQFNEQVRQFNVSEANKMSGGGTSAGRAEGVLKAVAQDARKGVTLNSIMRTYGTSPYVSPDDILRIYNTNSKYGAAKESSDVLSKLYGVAPTGTAQERNTISALKPATQAISSISSDELKLFGPQNKLAKVQIGLLGGLGADQKLVSANQKLELLKQNVVRALQGARASDQDIKTAQNYIPSITDTSSTAQTKLNNLRSFISSLGGSIDTNTGNISNNSNITQPDGTVWKQNSDGSYTRIK